MINSGFCTNRMNQLFLRTERHRFEPHSTVCGRTIRTIPAANNMLHWVAPYSFAALSYYVVEHSQKFHTTYSRSRLSSQAIL
jgi:hypothetical protein